MAARRAAGRWTGIRAGGGVSWGAGASWLVRRGICAPRNQPTCDDTACRNHVRMDDSRLEPWKLLMTACKASGGVVTASQATALGLERGFLPRLVSSGTVVREWQGVYR